MSRMPLTVSAAAVLLAGSAALALPFVPSAVSGSATLRVGNASFAPETVQTTPIVFPQTFSQTLTSSYTGAQAGLDYTLGSIGQKAVFDFYAMDHTGEGGSDTEGYVEVDMTVTTNIPTYFTFTAINPYSSEVVGTFQATFNGIVASKYFDRDGPGGIGGTFPVGPCPPCNPPSKTFFESGVLPAGTHQLTIDEGGFYRGTSATNDSKVILTLEPVPEMTTALLGLMGLSSLAMWRRRGV